MKNLAIFVAIMTGAMLAGGSPTKHVRAVRGILDWKLFGKSTSTVPTKPTVPPIKPNNLFIGECEEDDKVTLLKESLISPILKSIKPFADYLLRRNQTRSK